MSLKHLQFCVKKLFKVRSIILKMHVNFPKSLWNILKSLWNIQNSHWNGPDFTEISSKNFGKIYKIFLKNMEISLLHHQVSQKHFKTVWKFPETFLKSFLNICETDLNLTETCQLHSLQDLQIFMIHPLKYLNTLETHFIRYTCSTAC